MVNVDERLAVVEGTVQQMQSAWDRWIDKHDVVRQQSDTKLYTLIDQLSVRLGEFIDLNIKSTERLSNLRRDHEAVAIKVEFHEKNITEFGIYLKRILEELQNANLTKMRIDIDNLHDKHRENVSCMDEMKVLAAKEFELFKKSLDALSKELQIMKNAPAKAALKAWVWVVSIIGTAAITGLITHFVFNGS